MKLQTIVVKPGSKIEELVKELIDSENDRILFSSGPEATVLNQEINLRLLKFYAEEEEKEVWLQTANAPLKILAERLEIPLYIKDPSVSAMRTLVETATESVNETAAAPEDEESTGTANPFWQQGGMIMAIAAACFSLVIAIWWFFQPTVVVTIYPKEKDLNFRAQAQINTGYTDRQLAQGKIPGKIVTKEASFTVNTVTTGRKTIGVSAATGKITFINNSTQTIIVPKGSVLIGRENSRFMTVRDVLVSRKTSKTILGIPVGEEYGRAEVAIIALEKGVSGNQPAKAIQKIEGSLQRSLKVINLIPTMNGADKQIGVVAPEDLRRSEAEAQRQMELVAPDELAVLIGRDNLFWPDLVQTTITRNLFHPEIGMESANLTNRLDYRASAFVVSRVDLNKYLSHVLTVKTPMNFRPVSRSVELITTNVVKKGDDGAALEIEAKARIRGVLDPQKLQGILVGKALDAAKEALTAQDEIADFQINLRRPVTRLPRFPFQIKVLLPEGITPR